MISLTVLLKILEIFKGDELHLRYSYIDAVLQYNNVSVDLHSLLECYRETSDREATTSTHGSHTFSAKTKDLPDLHHRNTRQSGSLQTFHIRNDTSPAKTPIKAHNSFSNQTSSLPKLIPSNRTLSSQAKKRDIANVAALPNTSIALQRKEIEIGSIQQRNQGSIQQRNHLPSASVVSLNPVSCVNHSNNLSKYYIVCTVFPSVSV